MIVKDIRWMRFELDLFAFENRVMITNKRVNYFYELFKNKWFLSVSTIWHWNFDILTQWSVWCYLFCLLFLFFILKGFRMPNVENIQLRLWVPENCALNRCKSNKNSD